MLNIFENLVYLSKLYNTKLSTFTYDKYSNSKLQADIMPSGITKFYKLLYKQNILQNQSVNFIQV